MKYCPTSTVVTNPTSVQNLLNLSCCDNFSIRPLCLCNKNFLCRIIIIQKHVCLDHTWNERGTRLPSHNGLPRSTVKGFTFFTHFCDCSVETELIYRNNCAKNCLNRFLVGATVYRQFSATFAWTMDSWLGILAIRFPRIPTKSFPPDCPRFLVDCPLPWSTTFSLIQVRGMTVVLLRIFVQREKRVEHLTCILSRCPLIPMRCR